ncbi:MAG TPA: hypothetical protein DHW42_11685 [Candidatus Marinimicrobia bacterium]|nr:hypothetical protein [Candidatus Neomarinimicrobiota bacterium]
MRINATFFSIVFVVLILLEPVYSEVELHGFFRNHGAFRLKEPNDAMMLRNRLRLNSELRGDNIYGYASVDFLNDATAGSQTTLNLRELYLDIYSSWIDFRIGKQQVVWGKADGYFINDIVNPLDLSYFLLQDFDDIRMATTMLNTKLHHGNHSLEILMIPEFKPMKMALTGDWAFQRPDSFNITVPAGEQFVTIPIPMNYQEDILSQNSLRRMEYGFKFNTFLLGTDISLIYLKVREDKPVIEKQLVYNAIGLPSQMNLKPTHPWINFYGMNFSRPVGTFVFRGEGGYYPNRYFDTQDMTKIYDGLLVKKPFLQGMIGVDYQLTGEIDIGVQAIRERILDYDNNLMDDELNSIGSLMLRGRFANETILPLWLTLYNITSESYLSRIAVDWKYSDSFTITTGFDILGGGSDTIFGQFDRNDNVYLKIVYDF